MPTAFVSQNGFYMVGGLLNDVGRHDGSMPPALVVPVASHVDHDGACKDQNIVFPVSNLHAVGIRQ